MDAIAEPQGLEDRVRQAAHLAGLAVEAPVLRSRPDEAARSVWSQPVSYAAACECPGDCPRDHENE